MRGSGIADEVRETFEGRLQALAGAHRLLTRTHWEATDLKDVVRDALTVCGASDRAIVEGPPLLLGSSTAVTLAIALHELCTNAIKYGALSVESGRVRIDWSISAGDEPRFVFHWQESGGPQVTPPKRRGFGSRLVEQALASDLKGETGLEFKPDGVRFSIDAPLPSHVEAMAS